MKRQLIIIIAGMMLTAGTVKAQSWPKPELRYDPANFEETMGKWMTYQGAVVKFEKLDSLNIKNAIYDVKRLLALIKCNYDTPQINRSMFHDNETEEDTKTFYLNASLNHSSLAKSWIGRYNGKPYFIALIITDKLVSITYKQVPPQNKG